MFRINVSTGVTESVAALPGLGGRGFQDDAAAARGFGSRNAPQRAGARKTGCLPIIQPWSSPSQ